MQARRTDHLHHQVDYIPGDRRPHLQDQSSPTNLNCDLHPSSGGLSLPPHIAQIIAGHRDINVTLGYKAVYPEEAIQAHLAFLARRRALRPSEEYRVPTDEEWTEFLGHFERRRSPPEPAAGHTAHRASTNTPR